MGRRPRLKMYDLHMWRQTGLEKELFQLFRTTRQMAWEPLNDCQDSVAVIVFMTLI